MFFIIYNEFDVDGGLGDAITKQDTLGIVDFNSEEECNQWCKNNSITYIYDIPYNALTEGTLKYKPVEILSKDTILPEKWVKYDIRYNTVKQMKQWDEDNKDWLDQIKNSDRKLE